MKAILISIQPQHVLKILNGSKTLELRKSVPKGYVGWVYVYCTKGGETIYNGEKIYQGHGDYSETSYVLNGFVVARFWFDEYIKLEHQEFMDNGYEDPRTYAYFYEDNNEILDKLCITHEDIENYGKGKDLYAWHIKKLEVLEPMGLDSFYTWKWETNGAHKEQFINTLTKAPQSWQYVWVKENV